MSFYAYFRVLNTNLMHKIMFIIVELFSDVHIYCGMFAYKFYEVLDMFIWFGFGLSSRFLDLMMIDYDISDC